MSKEFNKNHAVLLKKLCSSLLGDKKDCLEMIFRKSIESLIKYENEEFYTSFSLWEEQQINEEIEKILNKRYSNSEEIIGRFHALNRSFRDISDNTDCYIEQLLFLLRVSEQSIFSKHFHSKTDENVINGNINLSCDFSHSNTLNSTNFTTHQWNSIPSLQVEESLEKKIMHNDSIVSPASKKTVPTNHLFTDTPIHEPTVTSSRKGSGNRIDATVRHHVNNVSSSEMEGSDSLRPNVLVISKCANLKKSDILGDFEVSEYEIMKELVFCMQGVEGKIIKYKSIEEGFHLNPCIKVNQPYMVLHLMELGFLHNKIKFYTSTLLPDMGTVAQGLLNAIRREITEYYQALAILDSQLNPTPELADTPLSEMECTKYKLPSLSQLLVWSRHPFLKLQTLYDVLNIVQNKRGGHIVSDLAFLSYNGNPKVKNIILRLLSSAIQPFYKQIFYWVVHGEIIDIHKEFFIEVENCLENIENRDTWDAQFVLRPSMIPNYMSFEEANQILEAGRCMNFLHNICHQRPSLTPAQVNLVELEKNKWNDPFFLIEPGNQVSELINKAYREVSRNVLKSLNENFKMMTHLEALRKYMLLGQGDFVHYLLEIIEPDLNKCVGALHTYTLMRSLEDAVYKSNAQYDDPDVLGKLCVKMLVTSEKDSASEAFCLNYRLEGPLNTIFKLSCVGYNRLFTFMWRVKRANYMVLKIWRGLKLLHKEVHKLIPETKSIFMKANCLVMEMVNFISHFQYYISSEVVEVSWRKFQSELIKLESLEKVLQAHNSFLETMQTSCMLNAKSGSRQAIMLNHIRSLLDYVQELVPIVEMFQTLSESEIKRRKTRQEDVAKYGVSFYSEQENSISTTIFTEEISKVKAKFTMLASTYHEKVKSLLMLFSRKQEENDLILLSHRIDFNEYYKQNDSRLSDSLKIYKKS